MATHRTVHRVLSLVAVALVICACATSPLGRNQLVLFPASEISQMGAAAFQDIKKQTPVASGAKVNSYVDCVARNIISALPNGQPEQWEIKVFDKDEANAFALPGRKIGVYTGILDVAKNQSQLATVIGHEVGHVLSNHANERVSTNFVTQSGLQLAEIAVGANTPMKQQLFGLLGLGAQVGVLLPFSRTQEAEADLVGLDLMAKAGFDPRESVKLWQNMKAQGGEKQPAFLSTHPANDQRIAALENRMPQAMQLSLQARNAGRTPDCR